MELQLDMNIMLIDLSINLSFWKRHVEPNGDKDVREAMMCDEELDLDLMLTSDRRSNILTTFFFF